MFGRLVPEGFRRVLALCAVAATFVLLPGCAVKTIQYAEPQVEPYLKAMTRQSLESQQKPVPAEFADARYMEMVPGTLIPAHNRDFVPEEAEMQKVAKGGGSVEFGVTAMQAIGNIYDQIETTKPKGRRSR